MVKKHLSKTNEIFLIYITDERLTFIIYKELLKFEAIWPIILYCNEQNIWAHYSQKEK